MTKDNSIELNENGEAVIKYRVNYYETDKMGVVHHSNYIRWFETVRVRWMDAAGIPYSEFEDYGVITPVTEVKLKYRHSVQFNEVVTIVCKLKSYNSVRSIFDYKVYNENGTLACTGSTENCFVKGGKPVILRRVDNKWDEAFKELLKKK